MSGKAPGVGLICELAEDGDIVEIQRVLMNMPYLIDSKDDEGKTPLHSACDYGHTEVAREFLGRGADVNAMTKTGTTPLHWAARGGYDDIIMLLLEYNAYLNVQNKFMWSPLHWACYKGHLGVVQQLIDVHADINIKNHQGHSPMHYLIAAYHVGKQKLFEEGYADFILKVCEEAHVDLNIKNRDGMTLLHCVCESGHFRLVQEFVDRGAHLNARTNANDTPIFYALKGGYDDIAKYLVIKGAVINSEHDEYLWEPGHKQWGGPELDVKPDSHGLGMSKQQVIKAVKDKLKREYEEKAQQAIMDLESETT